MSEFRELYQEVILDHNRNPRNFGVLEDANRFADGTNPLCGDKVKITLRVEDGKIAAVRFDGMGCAISTASASVMTETLLGKSEEDAQKLFESFHDLITHGSAGEVDKSLGKLKVFGGVSEYPTRIKCAILCWHTMKAALDRSQEPVTTE